MYILLDPFTYGANDQSLKPDNKVAYAEVLITLYENGSHEVLLKRSSGNEKLDEKIVNAVKAAAFAPIKNKKVKYPVFLIQPFEIRLNDAESNIEDIPKRLS